MLTHSPFYQRAETADRSLDARILGAAGLCPLEVGEVINSCPDGEIESLRSQGACEGLPQRAIPIVFVVIPVMNNIELTLDCVESLEKQSYDRIEIVAVDNASTDETPTRLKAAHPAATVLSQESNRGYAEACNIGMQWALDHRADFVLLLNNDTIVEPMCIQLLVEAAINTPRFGAASPVIYFHSESDLIWYAGGSVDRGTGVTAHLHYKKRDVPHQEPYATEWVNGCALLVSRSVLESVGLLDPSYFASYEDVDLSLRLAEAGFAVVVVPKARVWHRVSATWGGRGQFYYYTARNRLLLLRKRRGWRLLPWTLRLAAGSVLYTTRDMLRGKKASALGRSFEFAGICGFMLRQTGKAPAWVHRHGSRAEIER